MGRRQRRILIEKHLDRVVVCCVGFSLVHVVSYKPWCLYLGSRSLGLPLVEQVTDREVGESDTYSLVSSSCSAGLHDLGFSQSSRRSCQSPFTLLGTLMCFIVTFLHYIQTHIQSRTQSGTVLSIMKHYLHFSITLKVALLHWPSVESPATYACHKRCVNLC